RGCPLEHRHDLVGRVTLFVQGDPLPGELLELLEARIFVPLALVLGVLGPNADNYRHHREPGPDVAPHVTTLPPKEEMRRSPSVSMTSAGARWKRGQPKITWSSEGSRRMCGATAKITPVSAALRDTAPCLASRPAAPRTAATSGRPPVPPAAPWSDGSSSRACLSGSPSSTRPGAFSPGRRAGTAGSGRRRATSACRTPGAFSQSARRRCRRRGH